MTLTQLFTQAEKCIADNINALGEERDELACLAKYAGSVDAGVLSKATEAQQHVIDTCRPDCGQETANILTAKLSA